MSEICAVVQGKFLSQHNNDCISVLAYDSRRIQQNDEILFFALVTSNNDGHSFLRDAYKRAIRNFIVCRESAVQNLPASTVILVPDTLEALQSLASFHRTHFDIPVIGITGSNGKTIVKEWLNILLQDEYNIVRSPKSFNSQIGVPLSVWQLNDQHNLAIFEAGISTVGEMARLEEVIHPTIGVLTNIGEAHDAGFASKEEKLDEKLKLFRRADVVIGDYDLLKTNLQQNFFSIGRSEHATLHLKEIVTVAGKTKITAVYKHQNISITIPFGDEASVQNAITCLAVLLFLDVDRKSLQEKFSLLHSVDMRLQLRQGINNCLIVNDSYSADTTSLKIALDFLQEQSSGRKRTAILSEFFESGKPEQSLYFEIVAMLKSAKVTKLIAIGERFLDAIVASAGKELNVQYYASTENFISSFRSSTFTDEIILIKGARKFQFERIADLFEKRVHQTVLEINLNALADNLKEYRRLLQPSIRLMAMVKAFSYGSGGAEIAGVLQFNKVDYLGVAYADEGVELIKAGIIVPIMVMNAEEATFRALVDYNLQPVIYSFHLFHSFANFLKSEGLLNYPVHLEIETGMNRLGFKVDEVEQIAAEIASSPFRVESVFSHLAASEDPGQDQFTMQQFSMFQKAVKVLDNCIPYQYLKHIANSAAIVRHPNLQMDMVRLGIGLYGVESDEEQKLNLQAVATLRSTVAQLKHVRAGESISYNRRGVVNRDSMIATVRIGYADGFSRRFSNGVGKMLVKGKLAPVIGTVCMDMTMIDVTDIPGVREGDDVIVFGQNLPVQQLAKWAGTIPYEIMTGVSQRVKRIYFFE